MLQHGLTVSKLKEWYVKHYKLGTLNKLHTRTLNTIHSISTRVNGGVPWWLMT